MASQPFDYIVQYDNNERQIFFPRNVKLETQRWLREPTSKPRRFAVPKKFKKSSGASSELSQPDKDRARYLLTDSPVTSNIELPTATYSHLYPPAPYLAYDDPSQARPPAWDDTYGSVGKTTLGLTEVNLKMHSEVTSVNPMAFYFTSPIGASPSNVTPEVFSRNLRRFVGTPSANRSKVMALPFLSCQQLYHLGHLYIWTRKYVVFVIIDSICYWIRSAGSEHADDDSGFYFLALT